MQQPFASFRLSFWWLWLYVVVVATFIGVPIGVTGAAFAVASQPAAPPALPQVVVLAVIAGIGGAEILASVLVLAMVAYFRIRVGPLALGGYDFWCFYRELAWNDIVSVRRVNVLGLKYLVIDPFPGQRSLWLPLFLRQRELFFELVCQAAGSDNPLALAIHQELESTEAP